MGALTPTNVIGSRGLSTEFGGGYKLQVLTITPAADTDTVTLVLATDKIRTILGVFAQMVTGSDAALQSIEAAFSGLVITIRTFNGAGTAATDWTGASIRLLVIGV